MNKKEKDILEKYLPLPGKIKSEEDLKAFRAKIATNIYIIVKRVVNGSVVTQIYDREKKEYVENTVVNSVSLNQKAKATTVVTGMDALTKENEDLKAKLLSKKVIEKALLEGMDALTLEELKVIAILKGIDAKGLKKDKLVKLVKGDE